MRVLKFGLVAGLSLMLVLAFSACGKKEYPAELNEAKAALADSKAEGAPEKCPQEYTSAEAMLQKAEAFYAADDEKTTMETAKSATKLAFYAKDCAAKKSAAAPTGMMATELPKDLGDFKETIYFNFNDNSINSTEAAKLKKAAAFLQQYQGKAKFWVMLTAQADRPGNPQDNFELSRRRGIVVRYFLMDQGVDSNILLIKPVGEMAAFKEAKKDNKKNQEYRKVEIACVPYASLPMITVGNPFVYEKNAWYQSESKYKK